MHYQCRTSVREIVEGSSAIAVKLVSSSMTFFFLGTCWNRRSKIDGPTAMPGPKIRPWHALNIPGFDRRGRLPVAPSTAPGTICVARRLRYILSPSRTGSTRPRP